MSTHDQTTPVALHRLISRLLDDHQRIPPHHADLCPLCQDASTALDLLAEEVPDFDCPTCRAAAGEAHADTCPGKDGNCPLSASTIPLGISAYQKADGALGNSYRPRAPDSP